MSEKIPIRLVEALGETHNKNGQPSLHREYRSFGQRSADKVASFCGSWPFIIGALIFIAIWISINLVAVNLQWDPWPFILLNLTLSCIAALQAPIILMSQNRMAERDRLVQRYDYLVDRKASRDIEKIYKELKDLHKHIEKLTKKN